MSHPEPLECQAAREALSALIDQEDPGVGTPWLTEHLVGCTDCREWYAAAQDLRRRTRITTAPSMPPLRETIMAAIDPEPAAPRALVRLGGHLPRAVLVVCALLLLWRSLPTLLTGHDPDTSVHPAHELGSYQVALAMSLLLAAPRPRLARAIAPIIGLVGALLVATALIDLIHGGRTTWSDEAPHLLWLIAFAALVTMPRASTPTAAAVGDDPAEVTVLRSRELTTKHSSADHGGSTSSSVHRSA